MATRKTRTSPPAQPKQLENDDDSFGLPEIEPQPLSEQVEPPAVVYENAAETPAAERIGEPTPEPVEPQASNSPRTEPDNTPIHHSQPSKTDGSRYRSIEDSASGPPRRPVGAIIAAIVVVLLAMGGAYYWFAIKAPKDKARAEALAKEEKEKQAKKLLAEKAEKERRAREAALADSLAEANKKPTVGAIDTLTERTRRYYVVLASSVDGDLIMDYARKLRSKGISTHILKPYGSVKFTRLTMGDFDSYASAQNSADAAKAEYGGNLWVIRY